MSEYIVSGPFENDDVFIANMGAERTTLHGYKLVGEVVRCRDCKWFTPEYEYLEDRGFGMYETFVEPSDCGNPERCSRTYDSFAKKTVPVHIITDPDGFCKWGERRDE